VPRFPSNGQSESANRYVVQFFPGGVFFWGHDALGQAMSRRGSRSISSDQSDVQKCMKVCAQ